MKDEISPVKRNVRGGLVTGAVQRSQGADGTCVIVISYSHSEWKRWKLPVPETAKEILCWPWSHLLWSWLLVCLIVAIRFVTPAALSTTWTTKRGFILYVLEGRRRAAFLGSRLISVSRLTQLHVPELIVSIHSSVPRVLKILWLQEHTWQNRESLANYNADYLFKTTINYTHILNECPFSHWLQRAVNSLPVRVNCTVSPASRIQWRMTNLYRR